MRHCLSWKPMNDKDLKRDLTKDTFNLQFKRGNVYEPSNDDPNSIHLKETFHVTNRQDGITT